MDKLERYILQHRNQLDAFTPNLMTKEEFNRYMEDGLTHYIKSKRSSLDSKEPSEQVWENIKKELSNHDDINPSLEKMSEIASASLDAFAPSDKVWDKLSAALDENEQESELVEVKKPSKGKTISMKLFWQFAAAAIVLGLGLGFIFSEMNHSNEMTSTQILAKYAPDMMDAHIYYMASINMKQESIDMIGFEDSVMLQDFHLEIKDLNEEYEKLIKEFPNAKDPDLIKFGLMENLKLRIALLNKQMEIIDNVKQTNNTHEDDSYQL